MPPDQRRLRILCLHGSRQNGEVFGDRLSSLRRKLKNIAVRGDDMGSNAKQQQRPAGDPKAPRASGDQL
jgi:hypothetical protein